MTFGEGHAAVYMNVLTSHSLFVCRKKRGGAKGELLSTGTQSLV